MEKISLQKYLTLCRVFSRRQAEKIIKSKQIIVNKKIGKITDRVNQNDEIKFQGKILKPITSKIYIMFHKPEGYTVTKKIFPREKNIFQLIKTKYCLHPVGRLDKNSSGLLILTNDGQFTQKLTHPRYQHEKEYEIFLFPSADEKKIQTLKKGVTITVQGKRQFVKAKRVRLISPQKIRITLTEGKKRQIRLMLSAVNLKVIKLKRIRIGKLLLGNLPLGKWRYLSRNEVKKLLS